MKFVILNVKWEFCQKFTVQHCYKRRNTGTSGATLGTQDDEQRLETLDGLVRSRFMLHYNSPLFLLEKLEELELAEEKLVMEN